MCMIVYWVCGVRFASHTPIHAHTHRHPHIYTQTERTTTADETGHCQAAPCPSHSHVAQLLQRQSHSHALDHVAYYPPTPPRPRYRIYLSLTLSRVLVIPLTAGIPSTVELASLYAWLMTNRHAVAYRYIRTLDLPPTPNQSSRTRQSIEEWCDTQIDAFTRFSVCR